MAHGHCWLKLPPRAQELRDLPGRRPWWSRFFWYCSLPVFHSPHLGRGPQLAAGWGWRSPKGGARNSQRGKLLGPALCLVVPFLHSLCLQAPSGAPANDMSGGTVHGLSWKRRHFGAMSTLCSVSRVRQAHTALHGQLSGRLSPLSLRAPGWLGPPAPAAYAAYYVSRSPTPIPQSSLTSPSLTG